MKYTLRYNRNVRLVNILSLRKNCVLCNTAFGADGWAQDWMQWQAYKYNTTQLLEQQPDGSCLPLTLQAVKSSVLRDSLISASFLEDELPVAPAKLSMTFLNGRRFILKDYISMKSSKKWNNSIVNIPVGNLNAPEILVYKIDKYS